MQEPIEALRDLGFGVDVSDQEIDFWDGETFQGNLDVEDSNLSLEVDLEDGDNIELVTAIIKGLDEKTVSAEMKDQMLTSIESMEDEQINFDKGYMEINDGSLNLKIKSTSTQ